MSTIIETYAGGEAVRFCGKCNSRMTKLFLSYVCDVCNPPKQTYIPKHPEEVHNDYAWMAKKEGHFLIICEGKRQCLAEATHVYSKDGKYDSSVKVPRALCIDCLADHIY